MKKYDSIVRHGQSSTHLTVLGNPKIVIQEKLDGANASFMRYGNSIIAFSRNNQLGPDNTLRGFYEWTQSLNVKELKEKVVYFGEWLVKHTLRYGENENQFYLFDVYNDTHVRYEPWLVVRDEADRLNIKMVPTFYVGEFQSFDHIKSYVGKSHLGEIGEGVVIKNYDFRNKNGEQIFTKIVSKEFSEIAKIRTHNPTPDESPIERFISYALTETRVTKLLHKLVDENLLTEDYAIEDMGVILKHIGPRVFEDILKEESDTLHKMLKKSIGSRMPNMVKEILYKEGRS